MVQFVNCEHFERLRWNIFESIKDIQVESIRANEEDDVKLSPLENHPISDEPATLSGLSCMTVGITELDVRAENDENFEEDRYEPPDPLILQTDDGKPITVGYFVTKVHDYLMANKVDIVETTQHSWDGTVVFGEIEIVYPADPPSPGDVQFFFWKIGQEFIHEDSIPGCNILIYVEGQYGQPLERFWKTRDGMNLGSGAVISIVPK
jgi:hypothetical protein